VIFMYPILDESRNTKMRSKSFFAVLNTIYLPSNDGFVGFNWLGMFVFVIQIHFPRRWLTASRAVALRRTSALRRYKMQRIASIDV
jgi:hypothetical protein